MSIQTPTQSRSGDAPPPAAPSAPRKGWTPSERVLPYLLLVPALVFELLVHIGPMLVGVYISFTKLDQYYLRRWLAAPFAWFRNYEISLNLQSEIGVGLLRSVGVSIAYSVVVVGGAWLLGLLGATLLQQVVRGRSTLRTVFLIPYTLPVFASVIVWKFMFSQDNGMVNHVLRQTGLGDGEHFWLLGNSAFFSMSVVGIWRLWPFALLTLMAGMQSIPTDMYEAAGIDGANRWRQFRELTLPALAPVNQVLLLVLFLWSFNEFNVPFTLFASSVPASADLVSVHVYQSAFITWNFGLGSAMSVLMLLFLLGVTMGHLALTKRRARRA